MTSLPLRLRSISAFLTVDPGRSQRNTMVENAANVCSCQNITGYRERLFSLSLFKFDSTNKGLAWYWEGGGYWKYQSLKVLCYGISALPGRHGNESELVEQGLLTAQKHSSHIEIMEDNMHAKAHVICVLSFQISTTQNSQSPSQSTTSICTLLMEWRSRVQKAMLTSNGLKDWASFSGWRWFFTQSLYITNTADYAKG